MKIEWKNCLRIGVTALILYLIIHYWEAAAKGAGLLVGAAVPLLTGGVIAYVVNIVMTFYEKHYFRKINSPAVKKSRRPVCMLLAFVSILLLIYFIINMIVPELKSCIEILAKLVPEAIDRVNTELVKLRENEIYSDLITGYLGPELLAEVQLLAEGQLQQALPGLASGFGGALGGAFDSVVSIASTVFSTITSVVVGMVFAVYLLIGKEKIKAQLTRLMKAYLKAAWNEKIIYVVKVVNGSFHKFIVGQCTEAVILGGLCMIGMTIFRFPYAMMIGAFVGFTALIPVAGAYIGAGVGAFLILMVSPLQALFFLIFIVVLQQLEGNLIYPRVVGASIGLPGIWVLAAIIVGGGLMGIEGMLLGVPITSAAYQLLKNDVHRKTPDASQPPEREPMPAPQPPAPAPIPEPQPLPAQAPGETDAEELSLL